MKLNINKPKKTQNTIHSDNPSTKQRPGAMRASTYTCKMSEEGDIKETLC